MEQNSSKANAETDLDRDQYCELCGKMEHLLKCGRCRNSFYCSKEHQKQDWKKHKQVCKEAEKPQLQPEPQPTHAAKAKQEELVRKKDTPQNQTASQSTGLSNITADDEKTNFITSAAGLDSEPDCKLAGEGMLNYTKLSGPMRSHSQKVAGEYLVPCMSKHGICVVDNFLGEETGLSLLEDVRALYKTGRFTDGQLVSQRSDSSKAIRGDKITWVEGSEPGCEKIALLISCMDDLIRYCNGKLGNYRINGRTKVSTTQ